jgi:DNA/RNA endonuclease G (NUC1)
MKKATRNQIIVWVVMTILAVMTHLHDAQAQQIVVKYPGYTSYFNLKTLIPDSVIYICKPHAKQAGRLPEFHSSDARANLKRDYLKSGYDQGHNCDASDENGNKTNEYNSFDYVNVFPQRPLLNRRTWLALENAVRDTSAKYGQVRVKIYWRDTLGYIGPDKVLVPKICIKEIWYADRHELYEMPNADTVIKHVFIYYKK